MADAVEHQASTADDRPSSRPPLDGFRAFADDERPMLESVGQVHTEGNLFRESAGNAAGSGTVGSVNLHSSSTERRAHGFLVESVHEGAALSPQQSAGREELSDFFQPRDPSDAAAQDIIDEDEEERRSQKRKTLRGIYEEITRREFSARQRFFHIVHGVPVLSPDDIVATALNTFIMVMVVGSTITFVVETMPEFYEPDGPNGVFFILESIWVGVFTADLLLRIVAATSFGHVLNIQMLFDFLSIIGYYIALGVDTTDSAISFQILRMLRLTRVLRMSKLSRQGIGFSMMSKTVKRSKQGLLLLVLLVAISMVLCAAVIYSVEAETGVWDAAEKKWYFPNGEESPFQSIPHSFFFVLLTLTTVGYGDEVPSQGYGRAVAVGIMFFGVLLLSFPNILIGSNFQMVHEGWQRQRARTALGRRFRTVRYAVRFVRMWRDYKKHGRATQFRVSANYDIAHSFAPPSNDLQLESTFAPEEAAKAMTREENQRHRNLTRRTINFFFKSVDFDEYSYNETHTVLVQGKLNQLSVRGLEAVHMLQRLVQMFSCCCTVEEMYESLLVAPIEGCVAKQSDLVEMACHLANAAIIELFILNRFDDHMLMHISRAGIRHLQHFGEDPELRCVRSLAESRDIWRSTTSFDAPAVLPVDGFRRWQEMEPHVPKRSRITFTYDLKNPEARANCVFRNALHNRDASMRGRSTTKPRLTVGNSQSVVFGAGARQGLNSPVSPNNGTSGASHTVPVRALHGLGCPACMHCASKMPMETEEQLNQAEEFFLMQRRLLEEWLEVVSLRRALAVTPDTRGDTPQAQSSTLPQPSFSGSGKSRGDASPMVPQLDSRRVTAAPQPPGVVEDSERSIKSTDVNSAYAAQGTATGASSDRGSDERTSTMRPDGEKLTGRNSSEELR